MPGIHIPLTADNSNVTSVFNDTVKLIDTLQSRLSELERRGIDTSKILQNTSGHASDIGVAVNSSFKQADEAASAFGSTIEGLTGKLKSMASAVGAGAFFKKVYDVRSYYQDIESSMEVFLGSAEKASKFTKDLKDYAYYNMFEFSDLAAASQQLIAYGNEVDKISGKGGILDQLSNIATATKVPLMDLVNAWNKAKNTGAVGSQDMASWAAKGLVLRDVLKEMGIEASEGAITFEQLQAAISHVTQEGEMFGGLMDKMMPNLSSSWGQLEDNLSSMWNEIGIAMQEPMHDAIELAASLVENYKKIAGVLEGLVATYGIYKAAMITFGAIQKAQALGLASLTAAEKIHYTWLLLQEKAQKALNAAMLTNPYMIVAAGIAAIVGGLIIWKNLQKDLNDRLDDLSDATNSLKEEDGEHIRGLAREYDTLSQKAELSKDETERLLEVTKELAEYMPSAVTEVDEFGNAIDLNTESIRNQQKKANEDLIKATQESLEIAKKEIEKAVRSRDALYNRWKNNGRIESYSGGSGQYGGVTGTYTYFKEDDVKTRTEIYNKYRESAKQVAEAETQIAEAEQLIKDKELENTVLDLRDSLTQLSESQMKEFISDLKAIVESEEEFVDSSASNARKAYDAFDENFDFGDFDWSRPFDRFGQEAETEAESGSKLFVDSAQKELSKHTIDVAGLFQWNFDSLGKDVAVALYRAVSGSESSSVVTGNGLTDKQRQALYKKRQQQEKSEQRLIRDEIDMRRSLDQEKINAMEKGSAREIAQANLNYQKELEQIKRQREDKLKQLREDQKAQWLAANPNRKEYEFASNITESSEAFAKYAAMYKEMEDNARRAYESSISETESKFGTLAERVSELDRKWNDTIAGMSDGPIKERAEKEKRVAIAALRYNELSNTSLDNNEIRDALKEKIDAEIDLLEEGEREAAKARGALTLAEFGEKTVDKYGTRDQKRAAMIERQKAELATIMDLSQRAVAEAKHAEELAEFDYGNFDSIRNLESLTKAIGIVYGAKIQSAKASKDLAEAERLQYEMESKLAEAAAKYSATYALIFADASVLSDTMLSRAIEETQKRIKQAKDSGDIQALTQLYERLREQLSEQSGRSEWGFKGIASGMTELAKAKKELEEAVREEDSELFDKAVGDLQAANAKIKKSVQQVASVFGDLGNALSEFDGVLGGIGSMFSELSSHASDFELALTGTATKADAISSSLSFAINMASMIASSIKANKEAQEEWNKTVRQTAHEYAMLKLDALDYKQKNIFGVENPFKPAIDGALQYGKAMEELNKLTNDLNKGQVQTGTKKVVDWSNVGKGAAGGAATGALVGSIIPGLGTLIGAAIGAIVGGAAGSAATKTVPVFESLISKYDWLYDDETYELNPQIIADYEKLDDTTKQIVDNWQEIADKAKAAEDQMRQNFADLAGDMGKQLSDSLVAAFRNGALNSAIDDFHSKMTSTIEDIIQQMVFSTIFSDMFDDLEKNMMKSFGAGGDNNIVDDIMDFMESYQSGLAEYDEAMRQAQKAAKERGFDLFKPTDTAESQQVATAGGFQTMSQDTASELNGRFTALQICGENILQNVIMSVDHLLAVRDMTQAGGKMLSEIRDAHMLEVGYLEDIAKQTKPLLDFGEKLDKIEKNTSKL